MALKYSEKLGWRLNSLFHVYLWQMPVKWNSEYTSLIITKPIPNCIPFILLTIYELFLAITCVYFTFKYLIWDLSLNIHKIHALILISFGYALTALFILIVQAYGVIQGIVALINTLIDLADKCENEHYEKRTTQIKNSYMSLAFPFLVVPIAAGIPFVFVFCCMLTDLDPIFYILEELLPEPMYRSSKTIYLGLLFRIVGMFLGSMQFTRCGVLYLGCLFICVDRGTKILKALISGVISTKQFAYFYNSIFIATKRIDKWVHTLAYLVFYGLFWGNIVGCWIVVRSRPNQITLEFYLCILIMTILLIAGHIFIFPVVCNALEMILVALKVHRLRSEIYFVKFKSRQNKIIRLEATAFMPLRIKYGQFWYLGREFVPEYLWMLHSRCIDAILIFD